MIAVWLKDCFVVRSYYMIRFLKLFHDRRLLVKLFHDRRLVERLLGIGSKSPVKPLCPLFWVSANTRNSLISIIGQPPPGNRHKIESGRQLDCTSM